MSQILPLMDFFKKPEKSHVRLSPSGKYLSWLEPWNRRLNVVVKNIDTGASRRVTEATERDIYGFRWANGERIIYTMDQGGDENIRLFGVNYDGTNHIDFTPFENVRCDFVDILENDDTHILFQMNKRDKQVFDIFRLNVNTGEMEMIAKNPGNVAYWLTDHNGKLRLGYTADGLDRGIIHRETEGSSWRQIATYDFRERAYPKLFTYNNEALYVSSNVGRDKHAVFEYDLKTGKEGKLIFEHEEVDIYNLLCSRKNRRITGVSFVTEKLKFHFFDDFRKKCQKFVDKNLPDHSNDIISFDKEETVAVVISNSDRTLGSYYLLDIENWKISKLFDRSPWLNEDQMAKVTPIEYTARDGLRIQGYLTLPVGVKPFGLPLVVKPHGGPWSRDVWQFDPQIQFLANRGFAVLQMNFRGSAGYGSNFMELGFKQWGLSMQDDITDAVNWAIREEIADPKRVAIYGISYGGYATLMGIVKNPDLYAAAIDYVGVSNLFTFMKTFPPYWEPHLETWYEMVGHPVKDKKQFEMTSPALNADKIKTPLFIAQGANDPRVRKTESDQMVESLKIRGIDVEYMVKDNEGHGFLNEENRFDFYQAMEVFLNKHTGKKAIAS